MFNIIHAYWKITPFKLLQSQMRTNLPSDKTLVSNVDQVHIKTQFKHGVHTRVTFPANEQFNSGQLNKLTKMSTDIEIIFLKL